MLYTDDTVTGFLNEPRLKLFDSPVEERHAVRDIARPFTRSREGLRIRLYLQLVLLDVLCLVAGFALASAVWFNDAATLQTLRSLTVTVPAFLGAALHGRAYSQAVLQDPRTGVRRVVGALVYSSALVAIILFYLKISSTFSRMEFGLGCLVSLILMSTGRLAFGYLVAGRAKGQFINRILLVDGVEVKPDQGQVVIDVANSDINPAIDDPFVLDRLAYVLQHCESLSIACSAERRVLWAQLFKSVAIDVDFLIPELSALGAADLRVTEDGTTVVVIKGPLSLRDRVYKRSLDLVVACCAAAFFIVPMLLIALLIKLESTGPILFKQQRVGLNNRLFYLFKFRSMRADCSDPSGIVSASRHDPRVTRLGRILRKTSLDELPQLLNVIRGDMSIVGPRPHATGSTAENLLFWEIDRQYFHRHAAKPGLTGLAQIRGYRGATIMREDLTERLRADLEYTKGWTILRDIKIIFRTFGVLFHSNAF